MIDGQKDIPIGSSTTVTIDLIPSNFTTSTTADYKVTGDFSVTCNGIKQSSLTGAWTVTAAGATSFVATSSVSFTGVPYAATCTLAGDVTTTRGTVSSNTLPVTATFTTVADTLRYKEQTYALWTGAYPYAVTKTGVTPVVNKTKYTFGLRPLSRCAIMDPSFTVQTKGKALTECQASDGSGRHVLYIDPTKNEIYEYSGTVPTGIVWQDVTPLDLVMFRAGWSSQTKVEGGWYYTIGNPVQDNWVLRFLDDSTAISTIVKAGTFLVDGNINYLATYSN